MQQTGSVGCIPFKVQCLEKPDTDLTVLPGEVQCSVLSAQKLVIEDKCNILQGLVTDGFNGVRLAIFADRKIALS